MEITFTITGSFTTFDQCGDTQMEPKMATFTVQSAMPVSWQSIKLATSNNSNLLSFSTATESNNSHFDIQRSIDNRNWSSIGQLKGAGTTTIEQQYIFQDKEPLPGLSHYRIKQVDYDGTFSFSSIVTSKINFSTPDINVYPNPSQGRAFLKGITASEDAPTVQILSSDGRLIREATYTSDGFNTADLPSGMYMIRILTDGQLVAQQRLVIE